MIRCGNTTVDLHGDRHARLDGRQFRVLAVQKDVNLSGEGELGRLVGILKFDGDRLAVRRHFVDNAALDRD